LPLSSKAAPFFLGSMSAKVLSLTASRPTRLCNYSAHELKNTTYFTSLPRAMLLTSLARWIPLMQQREQGAVAPELSPSQLLTRSSLTWLATWRWADNRLQYCTQAITYLSRTSSRLSRATQGEPRGL
jgi:hypothetical protein